MTKKYDVGFKSANIYELIYSQVVNQQWKCMQCMLIYDNEYELLSTHWSAANFHELKRSIKYLDKR